MAISNDQKIDYLFKKVGFGRAKTDTNANKSAVNEATSSALFVQGTNVWGESNLIPTTIPGSTSGVVNVRPTSAPVETTNDGTASTNRTWKTGLIDWIPPEVGATYLIKVYVHTSGDAGNAASAGTQVFPAGSGNNDEWFFDYPSGTLNFIGTNLPNGVSFSGKSVYISGAYYTGIKGVAGPGTATTFTSLAVSGITTSEILKVGTAVTIGSNGNGAFTGIVTAASFSGNGANLTDLSIAASGWAPNTVSAGSTAYYATGTRVGIGTTVPHYNLHVGEIASSSGIHTDLYVENMSTFLRQMTTENISVGGALTATSYRLHNTSAHITAGIVTASTLVVGTALSTSNNKVGLGTPTPRAKLDVDGAIRYKTSSENVEQISSSSGEVTVDLAKGQTFNLNLTENVGTFVVSNSPSDSTTFTIKITQPSGSTYSVGIDTFRNNTTGLAATCFWPGGVIPTVTQTAGRTDIYSFKSFDSCASFFGVVGGQGFA